MEPNHIVALILAGYAANLVVVYMLRIGPAWTVCVPGLSVVVLALLIATLVFVFVGFIMVGLIVGMTAFAAFCSRYAEHGLEVEPDLDTPLQ